MAVLPETQLTTGGGANLIPCGTSSKAPCTLNDLYTLANSFSEYIIKIILPAIFFIGLFLTIWPLMKNPDSGESRAQAKDNLIKLLIGTGLIVGAYLIVRAVLLVIGVDTNSDVIQRAVGGTSINIPFIERAHADYLPGPTSPVSKKNNGEVCASDDECTSGNCVKDVVKMCQAAPATPANTASPDGKFKNPLTMPTVQDIIGGIANAVLFIGTIGVIYGYIRGALYLVTSQERPEFITKGKNWILWTTVVAFAVFGAEVLYNLIVNTTTSVFK